LNLDCATHPIVHSIYLLCHFCPQFVGQVSACRVYLPQVVLIIHSHYKWGLPTQSKKSCSKTSIPSPDSQMRLRFYYPEVWIKTDDEEQCQITKTHQELCHRSKMKLILMGWFRHLTCCPIYWLFCIIWQQITTMWLSRRLSPRQSSTWQPPEVNLRNGLLHLKGKMQAWKWLVSQATKAWARWSEDM